MISMRKTKKALLVLSMIGAMVFGSQASAVDTTSTGTIDFTKTGSITVTKYGTTITGNTTDNTPQRGADGTGLLATVDENTYHKVSGVEFTLYKIADDNAVKAYYNGTDATEYVLSEIDDTALNNNKTWKVTHGDDSFTSATVAPTETAKTVDGVVKFNNLGIGIYVLVETSAPAQITTPYAIPCLVSIPMVNTETSNNDASTWNYDIYVYPKNHIKPATVELTKYGKKGSAARSELQGVTFELKQYNTSSEKWVNVTKDDKGAETTIFSNLVTDENGKLKLENLPSGVPQTQYRLREVSAPDGYIVNSNPLYFTIDTNGIVTWNAANDPKFANINDMAVATGSETADLKIDLTNEMPDLIKKVKKNPVPASGEWVEDTQYRMDQTIKYRLSVYVPKDVNDMDTFEIVDMPQKGIKDIISAEVTVTTANGVTLSKTADYTIEEYTGSKPNNGTGFKIVLTEAGKKKIIQTTEDGNTITKGQDIYIEYTAQFTGANTVIEGDGNGNTARLTYSKNTKVPDKTSKNYNIEDQARVYTYQLQITKHKDKLDGDPIENVEFELYYSNDGKVTGNAVKVVGTKGKYHIQTPLEANGDTTLVTDKDGKIIIQGLEDGTYFLKEIKTVEGYNLLSEEFEVSVDKYKDIHANWTDNHAAAFSGTTKTGHVYTTSTSIAPENEKTFDIVNKKGFVLPQTGSMGTILFGLVGVLLVLGGLFLLFGGRKKHSAL